jgi:hypothetical protein
MSRTKEQLEDGELAQCRRFIEWRRKQFDEQFTIIGRPNPPDFILELSGKQTWLEVTDVFPKDEDVDWLLAVTPPSRDLENADDQFVEKAVKQLNTKLSKKSYLSCFNQLGQGFLMLTDRYYFINAVPLHQLEKALRAGVLGSDLGCFKEAYLECYVEGAWQYGMIYPQPGLIDEDA